MTKIEPPYQLFQKLSVKSGWFWQLRLDARLWFTKILSADSCFLIYRLINVNGRMVKTLSGQEYGL